MPRILVIDDEEMVRIAIAYILRSEGWQAELAADGQQALEMARRSPPDAFVCDLNMPGIDGFKVLDEVRHDPVLKTIPFVVITGQTARGNEERAMGLGANAVLLKPFGNDALLGMIRSLIAAPGQAAP